MKAFLSRQRLPVAAIRIANPAREARAALAFACFYVAAAAVTGLVVRTWPIPLWGASYLTQDTTYVLGLKIGLLLLVPAFAIRHAGYGRQDLLLGWRATPRSVVTLLVLFAAGVLVNAGLLPSITSAARSMPQMEAVLRIGFGGTLMLFCAALPEELVYRWGLQTRLERQWGRPLAIVVTAVLFTAWHLPSRYLLASGAEGTAGDLRSVLVGTGLPVLVVGLVFGWAWDRWRNLPALVALHWGIDTLPAIASFLHLAQEAHH